MILWLLDDLFDKLFELLGDIVGNILNILWGKLCCLIYGLINIMFNLFTDMTTLDIIDKGVLNGIYQRITMIMTIVMVFYITFAFVKYVVSPDTITDKEKGVGNILTRIIVSILLIAFIPNIFTIAMDLQNRIIKTNVISKVIFGQKDFNYKNAGSNFAGDVFAAFYRVDCDEDCSESDREEAQKTVDRVIKNFKGNRGIVAIGGAVVSSMFDGDIQFDGLLAVVFGLFVLYVIFLYCMDMGTRYVQLIFLQVIAPIAAISYILPQKDGMFQKWCKQTLTTYLDVFIRIAILYFMLLFASIAAQSFDFYEMSAEGKQINIFMYLLIITGLLTFIGKAPKLLEELLPFKSGSASIGFGFSAKNRLDPVLKPVAATAGAVGGALGTAFKKKQNGKLGLNKDLIKNKDKGKGAKKRLKRAGTYAAAAINAGYRGAAAGAKSGRFASARKAASETREGFEKTVNDGGSVLGSMFRGGHYHDEKVKMQVEIEYLEEMSKRKKNTSESAGNLKLSKQLSSMEESVTASGDTAAIVAFSKARKNIEKAQIAFGASSRSDKDFEEFKNKVVSELDAFKTSTNKEATSTDENGEKVVQTYNDFISENLIKSLTTDDNLEKNDQAKYEDIKVQATEAFKVAKAINGAVYYTDPDDASQNKKIEVGDTLEQFVKQIGDITDQATAAASRIRASDEYKEATANANEKKGSN